MIGKLATMALIQVRTDEMIDSDSAHHAGRSRRIRLIVGSLALFALVGIAILLKPLTAAYDRFDLSRKRAAFIEAANDFPYRPVEGQLADDFQYRPLLPVFRSGNDENGVQRSKRLRLVGAASAFRTSLTQSDTTADAMRSVAAGYLLTGDIEAAIGTLQHALEKHPGEAGLLNDLSVAYRTRARSLRRPADTIAAIEAADHAWRLAPQSREVLWNRALAIESLGLLQEARHAWRTYLTADPDSEWAAEVRERLASMSTEPAAEQWRRESEVFERAAEAGDADAARRIAARFPVRAKERIERQWIARWGTVRSTDRARAERLLIAIESAATGIAETTNDRTTAGFVAAARSASNMDTFAAAHARIAGVRVALRERGTDAAVAELESIITELRRLDSPMAIVAAVDLGGWHYHAGRHEEALLVLDSVRDDIAARPWPLTAAKEAWNRGVSLTSLGRVTPAAASYVRAIEIYRSAGDPTHIGMLTSLLAANAQLANDISQEWSRYLEAARLVERYGDPDRVLVVLDSFSRVALRHESFGVGRILTDAVVARSGTPEYAPYRCHALITRCEIEMRSGSRSDASAQCASARQAWSGIVDEAVRNRLAADLDIATAATVEGAQRIELLTRAVDLSETRRDLYRLSQVLLLRARAYLSAGAGSLARPDLERGLDVIEEQRQRLESIPDRVAYMETSRGIARELVRLLVRSGDPDAALGIVERVRARSLTERLISDANIQPVTMERLRGQLGGDEAIVEYWTDYEELFTWVIRKNDVRFVRHSILRSRLVEEARRFVQSLQSENDADDAAPAATLYASIVLGIEPALTGITTVTIIADEALAVIPFAAVRDANGLYLLERFVIGNAPSAASFSAARTASLERFSSILVLANPTTREPLPPLDVRSEIVAARKLRKAAVYEGSDATAAVLHSSAGDYDVLHIAAHGFEERYSGEPVLAFTPAGPHDDGLLLASEAEQLALRRGALVCLAACRSASGKTSFEGAQSLARAFLAAGAGSVVAALWDVEDSASGALFAEFYAEIARGVAPAAALRAAQLSVLKQKRRSPQSWAAYQIYGGS